MRFWKNARRIGDARGWGEKVRVEPSSFKLRAFECGAFQPSAV